MEEPIFAIPASAANNVDVNFSIPIRNGLVTASTGLAKRMKQDSSSSYVNYKTMVNGTLASGPNKIEVRIFGAAAFSGTFVDCSSYTHLGATRTKAYITKGTRGLVRQDVYEKFGYGSFGLIYGAKSPTSTTGTAKGCWSVDSVGEYPYLNRVA